MGEMRVGDILYTVYLLCLVVPELLLHTYVHMYICRYLHVLSFYPYPDLHIAGCGCGCVKCMVM